MAATIRTPSRQPPSAAAHSSSRPSLPIARGVISLPSAQCASPNPEVSPSSEDSMLVMVPSNPLIKHWISVLRNEQTPCAVFKNALAELVRLLIYDASRDWLSTISGEIQTPMDIATVEFVDPQAPVMIIPILRAGLALAEHAPSVLPATKSYHLGMCRDETTLQPSVYLNKFQTSSLRDLM